MCGSHSVCQCFPPSYLCHSLMKHPGDFRTQWENAWGGRGKIFNLTTEPVCLVLLPLRQFARPYTIVPWCESRNREVICVAATEVPQTWTKPLATLLHDPGTRTFWDMPVIGALSQAVFSQSWSSSRLGFWGAWWPSWRDKRLWTTSHCMALLGNFQWVKFPVMYVLLKYCCE